MRIEFQLCEGGIAPKYQTEGAVGLDLHSAIATVLLPGARFPVATGVKVAIPVGYEAQVRPRSGMSMRGIDVAVGTIDQDYRGEIKALVINHTNDRVYINPGDRIAQLVIAPVVRAVLREVDELPPTARGAGGFGSTGT